MKKCFLFRTVLSFRFLSHQVRNCGWKLHCRKVERRDPSRLLFLVQEVSIPYDRTDFVRTREKRRSLGFAPNDTRWRVGFSSGIGCTDPRSQKRDPTARRGRLGHPSVSPFDIAEGTSFVVSLPTRLSKSASPNEQMKSVVPHLRRSTACLWTQPFRAGLIFGAGPLGLDSKHRFPLFIPPLT
jgi:hypothetical protein